MQMGLQPGSVTIIGSFPPVLSLHRLSVTPVVATISRATYDALRPSPDEVAAIFSVPLATFLEDHPRHTYWDAEMGRHQYRVHSFVHGPHRVWGLTAGILIRIAEAVRLPLRYLFQTRSLLSSLCS